ncbi:hypothetical protein CANARDRAFT_176152 [[Candida] arabinofermentans NRRL YB-2248]|uniref:ATPase V1 complex subunit H C-terminal domain-containing protein n=1 Tax=[Candida] arabinofermentans NRRL YB-2248 TaxID=983967 RepID=A0A1E4T0E8_9ASCO|nr:hypothetical protein CANARDRAFT_176152 [[Candida] arabinofermentans NRRL YB-2248]
MSYVDYLIEFKTAIDRNDGAKLSVLLSFLYHPDVLQQRKDFYKQIFRSYSYLIKALLVDSSFEEAIKYSLKLVQQIVKCSQYETGWICTPMMTVTSELRQIVYIYIRLEGPKHNFMLDSVSIEEKLVDVLQKPLKICLTDKAESGAGTKKLYVYFFANELFKCYFKFQKIEAANNLAKVLKKALNLPSFEYVPKSHLVNYKYYNGLISCMNNDLKSANSLLTEALVASNSTGKSQQRAILMLLIPIRFLMRKAAKFKLEGDFINDIVVRSRSRTIGWESHHRSGALASDEAECLKEIASLETKEKVNLMIKQADLYSTKMIALLARAPNDEIVRFILVSLIEASTYPGSKFSKNILNISHVDSSLPYDPLVKLLKSDDENIRFVSAYILTSLLVDSDETYTNKESTLSPLYEFLSVKLLSSPKLELNFLAVQMLKELLTIKPYRLFFWESHTKLFPPLLKIFSERRGELQMKYYATMSIWLLTFNPQALCDIEKYYPELIGTLYTVAKDAVKEKIVRLSISSLLNLVRVEKGQETVIKQFLLVKGLEITKQLIERKWADDELKADLDALLEILNEAVTTLTTYDEYEIELNTKRLSWSPSHKSDEFWIENVEKFKENNWKLLAELISLLSLNVSDVEQLYLNQAIVCFDVSQIIKVAPEVVKVLGKTGGKTKIMTLMSSPNSNVKFEALRTTQKLVANSL